MNAWRLLTADRVRRPRSLHNVQFGRRVRLSTVKHTAACMSGKACFAMHKSMN